MNEDYLILQDTAQSHRDYRGFNANQSGMTCFRIDPTAAKLVWSLSSEGNYGNHASPLICGNYAYGAGNGKGGKRVQLDTGKVDTAEAGIGSSLVSAVASDGRILQDSTLYFAEGSEFRKLGGLPIHLLSYTMPCLADGRLYCRGGNGKKDQVNPHCAVY